MGPDTYDVVGSPLDPGVAQCASPPGTHSLLGPAQVSARFATDFLLTGTTKQPSASGRVTGPRPTLSLAVGRLDIVHWTLGPEKNFLESTGKEEQDPPIPLPRLRRRFAGLSESWHTDHCGQERLLLSVGGRPTAPAASGLRGIR